MITKEILQNQKRIQELTLIPREFQLHELEEIFSLRKIIALIGSRRAGKTFLTFQIIKMLVEQKKLDMMDVCYVDLSGMLEKNITLQNIRDNYISLFPSRSPLFVFDEIQELDNFAPQLISLLNEGYKIIITGSNAHLLSKELSTILRGKVYSKEVFPLNFREYLTFRSLPYERLDLIRDIPKYRGYFLDFLRWGGFPEIAIVQDEIVKENILKSYFDIMIYKDLQDRYNIKNDYALKFFIRRILSTFAKELNINKVFNELKGQNIKISKDSLYNFYEYLDDIYLVSPLSNYWAQIKGSKKTYLIDVAFSNLVSSSEDLGQRFENFVYLELLKKYQEIYFLKKNYEIDFYLPGRNTYIQVVYHLDSENLERETQHLSEQEGKKIVIYFEKISTLTLPQGIEFLSFDELIFSEHQI